MELKIEGASKIGENIVVLKQDNQLFFVVDLDKEIGLSKSGKMMGIASTGGFTKVAGTELKMNMYLGRKNG